MSTAQHNSPPHNASSTVMLLPPLLFEVSNRRWAATHPQGWGELWLADVKAVRGGQAATVFAGIVFLEGPEVVSILGIENGDGRPTCVTEAVAAQQQAFTLFLREQTQLDNEAFGPMSALFFGHEYACEFKATAAYVVNRGEPMHVGVGYWGPDGQYEGIAIDKADRLMQQALVMSGLG